MSIGTEGKGREGGRGREREGEGERKREGKGGYHVERIAYYGCIR